MKNLFSKIRPMHIVLVLAVLFCANWIGHNLFTISIQSTTDTYTYLTFITPLEDSEGQLARATYRDDFGRYVDRYSLAFGYAEGTKWHVMVDIEIEKYDLDYFESTAQPMWEIEIDSDFFVDDLEYYLPYPPY